ncbi:hypothetical protein NHQ30_001729 [Ciborinia camelliae]|nr:hypothetical protein NHQ30_001729 [Ciborinia camelliae]
MSQSYGRTISSSPELLRERPSNLGSSSSRLPSPPANIPAGSASSRERRRTPNPHNPPGQSSRTSQSLRAPGEMEANPRPDPTQRLSEIVIDLTSDQDDVDEPAAPPRRAYRMHTSPRPPPRLGRSDAGLEQVVDLTADDEDDEDDTIVITHSRELAIPRSQRRLPPHLPRILGNPDRMEQPPPLGGRATPPAFRGGNANGNHMEPPRPPPGRAAGGFRAYYENNAAADFIMGIQNYMGLGRGNLGGDDHVGVHFYGGDFPAMPNGINMDYGRVALQDNKPEHVAPPPVGDGFTRSPTESDTAICPSCEEELIHRKDGEEPVAKKSRGAPSKKDREEHPFWVVKDCGHVFCNKCFQNRSNNKIASFRGSKNLLCAVEDCDSIVKNKDRWVGIFL